MPLFLLNSSIFPFYVGRPNLFLLFFLLFVLFKLNMNSYFVSYLKNLLIFVSKKRNLTSFHCSFIHYLNIYFFQHPLILFINWRFLFLFFLNRNAFVPFSDIFLPSLSILGYSLRGKLRGNFTV